ncbi:MAG: hypothetical protein A4E45_00880 [Methanosaeta sp. PtaB.Bin039]|nr:MAG: hypothetical protein A4E45_00880 [Methanosaeta sp. PtaB.Bin039]
MLILKYVERALQGVCRMCQELGENGICGRYADSSGTADSVAAAVFNSLATDGRRY